MSTYRHGVEEERPRSVRYGDLSPATQGRLGAMARGEGEVLLADVELPPGEVWAWRLLAAAGVAGAAVAARAGYGDLAAPGWMAWARGGWAGLGLGTALLAAPALRRRRPPTPLPPGVYLLPLDLIDARADPIQIFPTSMLRQIRAVDNRLSLRFEGATYELAAPASAADLGRRLQEAQQRAAVAQANGDDEALRRVDPLLDERRAWPADAPRVAPPTPTRWGRWAPLALATGLLLGLLGAGRAQRGSDLRGLGRAVADRDDDALLAYIQRGGALADRADALRLDLAREAPGDGGLFRYLKTGGSRRDEADAELLRRLQASPREEAILRYLDSGGRRVDEANALLLQVATEQHSEALLRRYAQRGGKEAEAVERVLLPRLAVHQATRDGDPTLLRFVARAAELNEQRGKLTFGDPTPEVRAEAAAALQGLFSAQHRRLGERLGDSTPIARALAAILRRHSGELRELKVIPSVRYEHASEDKDSFGYPSDQEFANGLRGFFAEIVDPRFLSVSESPRQDELEVARAHLTYDIYRDWDHYSQVIKGKFTLRTPDGEFTVDVASRCHNSLWLRISGAVAHALREAVSGAQVPCPLPPAYEQRR